MQEHILLLFGFAKEQSSYDQLINSSPKDLQFTYLKNKDILKFGTSGKIADCINKELYDENIEKVIIIAHSLGAAYAIEFINKYPAKVKQLYLINPILLKNEVNLIHLFINITRNLLPNATKRLKSDLRSIFLIITNIISYIRLLSFGINIDLQDKLKFIHTPTTIIWGEIDYIVPQNKRFRIQELIKNSKSINLKNMEHNWVIHSPELFWSNFKN